MSDATEAGTARATIRPHEAAHFGAQAEAWWNPKGSSAMLHKLNPVRLGFLRTAIDRHWGIDRSTRTPLAGKRALDVGCGAGLLCEPLARLGASVTGVDAAAESIQVARDHAAAMGLLAARPDGEGQREGESAAKCASAPSQRRTPPPSPPLEGEGQAGTIRYLGGELSALGLGTFDLVTAMEVLEHVANKPAFVSQLASHLAPGGMLIVSTPNRTPASRALLVGAAEAAGLVPRGTHDWDDFVTPEELDDLLVSVGLKVVEMRGIAFSPAKGLHVSANMALDIILAAIPE